jgi:hypothetical protein
MFVDYRSTQLKQLARITTNTEFNTLDTHQRQQLQHAKAATLRNAFGMADDYIVGSSMEKMYVCALFILTIYFMCNYLFYEQKESERDNNCSTKSGRNKARVATN